MRENKFSDGLKIRGKCVKCLNIKCFMLNTSLKRDYPERIHKDVIVKLILF